jgi:gamma-F420-2:alpha-L-glutamate ligase
MQGWILYYKKQSDLLEDSHGVNRLLEAAQSKNIKLKVFSPEQFELIVSRDDKKSVLIDGEHHKLPDFIIPRLGSNTSYFALAILRQMEHLGVYVCNRAGSIEMVKDKLHIHQILAHSNLPTPKSMLLKFPVDIKTVKQEIGFPLIVKNIVGTEGKGIYLSESEKRFMDLMEFISSNNSTANIILQKFVKSSRGADLRVFVLGGRVIGCMKRMSSDPEEFKANYSRGGKVEPFELTPEIEWLATETTRLVGLDICGVDLLFDDNGFKICEANSSPGFKGLEQVVGKRVAEEIIDYIIVRLTGHLKTAL